MEIEQFEIFKHNKKVGREMVGYQSSVSEVMVDILKDRIFYEQSGGGVTMSGGEPLQQPDFLVELLKSCRSEGLTTIVDTSGQAPADVFDLLTGLVDCYLYDLKFIDPERHQQETGLNNIMILENLSGLLERGEMVRLRIPLIPKVTDTAKNLTSIADYIEKSYDNMTVDLLPYNSISGNKYNKYGIKNRLKRKKTQTAIELDKMADHFSDRKIAVNIGG